MSTKKAIQPIIKAEQLEGSGLFPFIPSREKLKELIPGCFIKIKVGRESFWCLIDEVLSESFLATVNNDLLLTSEHGLQDGDQLEIQFDEVLNYIS